jgi:hypothetical protein
MDFSVSCEPGNNCAPVNRKHLARLQIFDKESVFVPLCNGASISHFIKRPAESEEIFQSLSRGKRFENFCSVEVEEERRNDSVAPGEKNVFYVQVWVEYCAVVRLADEGGAFINHFALPGETEWLEILPDDFLQISTFFNKAGENICFVGEETSLYPQRCDLWCVDSSQESVLGCEEFVKEAAGDKIEIAREKAKQSAVLVMAENELFAACGNYLVLSAP